MSMASMGNAIEDLIEFASKYADQAVRADRASEQRFWAKLIRLMSRDDQDFAEAVPIFIQLITTNGDVRRIPQRLIADMMHVGKGLNDTRDLLEKKREFPSLIPESEAFLSKKFKNLKIKWDLYVLLAIKASAFQVGIRVDPLPVLKKAIGMDIEFSGSEGGEAIA